MAAPPPSDLIGIEARAIGSALLDTTDAALFVASIPAGRMTRPDHRAAARAIHSLLSAGEPVDVQTVARTSGVSASTLLDWTLAVPSTGQTPYLAMLIAEAYVARTTEARLRLAVVEASRAVDGSADVFDMLDLVQRDLSTIAMEASGAATADTHISAAVRQARARMEEWGRGERTDYAPSGFYSLDRTTGGLPVGELTTLAAMTGAGKTSLLGQSARTVGLAELSAVSAGRREAARPVVVFSAEMSAEQIAHRMAAGLSGVNLRRLSAGVATDDERRRYGDALTRLAALPVHVDAEPAPTLSHIAARLTQIEAMGPGGIAYVGIDYDEKVQTEGKSEELRVSAIAQGLKNTAKRFQAPVLALSQYSRAATHTEYPSNHWLRYSGKKEHESAQVIHWHWPRYFVDAGYDPQSVKGYDDLDPDLGALIVSKNRFGPKGTMDLYFEPETTTFRDPNEPSERERAPRITPF